jgi:ATP-binding cassette subfamily B protein
MANQTSRFQTFFRAFRLLAPYPKGLIAVFFLSMIGTAVGIFSGCTQKILVDDVLTGRLAEMLWTLQFLFLGAVLAESALMIAKRRITTDMSAKAAQGIRGNMLNHLLHMDYQTLQSAKESDLITDIQYGVDSIGTLLGDGVPNLIPDILGIAASVGIMAWIDWRLTLLSLPVYPLMILVTRMLNKRIYAGQKTNQFLRSEMMGVINESLNAAVMVRNHSCQDAVEADFERHQKALKENNVQLFMIYELLSRASWALIMVPYQAVLYGIGGSWLLASGEPTLGTILIFANLTNYLIGPVMSLVNMGAAISEAQAGFERIDRFLNLKQEDKPAFAEETVLAAEVRNVSFRYAKEERWVIKNFSVQIPQGCVTVLWGPSGGGKSTLLKLLYGLLPVPTAGEIGRNSSLKWSFFPQSPVLFNRTIAQNFLLANPKITRAQMQECLSAVGMKEAVWAKPQNLDFVLNRTEDGFSGGQYRRLCLAVFFSSQSDVWLLDEPTSSLDQESALAIRQMLRQMQEEGRTLVIATHDALLRELAAQVILVNKE